MGKKPKLAARVPIATGISTTIPVTGEKPKPEKGNLALQDDVLYAIFLILYEKDPDGHGLTVKQICDVLVARHPEMTQLSSKTSNLVSAKLNAYVKRVEKGDANLKFALSREWADASPKRMVYVYRGLLAKDFHVHAKNAMQLQKLEQLGNLKFASASSSFGADSFEATKQSVLMKPRRQTMFDFGSSRSGFADSASDLFVPYSSAPVAASLTNNEDETVKLEQSDGGAAKDPDTLADHKQAFDLDLELDDFEIFDTDDESGFVITGTPRHGKRSKSMSFLHQAKKQKLITAAAAAPRAPKTPCSHSPNAAAAAAALHAAALKAILAGSTYTTSLDKKHNWEHAVRSGFLNQDIGAPEDLSLLDLDKLFS